MSFTSAIKLWNDAHDKNETTILNYSEVNTHKESNQNIKNPAS